ncbi:MAG: YhbY family RNA-binding protein [Gemmatimonadales bacterium]|nr:MAG: YhbY family RNA-binding protein [Gemmatimonadales bacterium]
MAHLLMTKLTSKQRAHLRSLAHSLKPILQVGSDGTSAAFLESLEEAFNNRELLKVKVIDTSDLDVKEAAAGIREGLPEVHVVQTIGKTIVCYRPDPDEPEIRLPR